MDNYIFKRGVDYRDNFTGPGWATGLLEQLQKEKEQKQAELLAKQQQAEADAHMADARLKYQPPVAAPPALPDHPALMAVINGTATPEQLASVQAYIAAHPEDTQYASLASQNSQPARANPAATQDVGDRRYNLAPGNTTATAAFLSSHPSLGAMVNGTATPDQVAKVQAYAAKHPDDKMYQLMMQSSGGGTAPAAAPEDNISKTDDTPPPIGPDPTAQWPSTQDDTLQTAVKQTSTPIAPSDLNSQEWWKAFQSIGPNPYEMLAMNDANVSRGMMNAAIVNAPVLNRNADIMTKPTTEAYNADVSRAAAAENAAASRFGTSAGVFGTELGTVGQMSKEALTYQARANQEQAQADQQYASADALLQKAASLKKDTNYSSAHGATAEALRRRDQYANLIAMYTATKAEGDQHAEYARVYGAQSTGAGTAASDYGQKFDIPLSSLDARYGGQPGQQGNTNFTVAPSRYSAKYGTSPDGEIIYDASTRKVIGRKQGSTSSYNIGDTYGTDTAVPDTGTAGATAGTGTAKSAKHPIIRTKKTPGTAETLLSSYDALTRRGVDQAYVNVSESGLNESDTKAWLGSAAVQSDALSSEVMHFGSLTPSERAALKNLSVVWKENTYSGNIPLFVTFKPGADPLDEKSYSISTANTNNDFPLDDKFIGSLVARQKETGFDPNLLKSLQLDVKKNKLTQGPINKRLADISATISNSNVSQYLPDPDKNGYRLEFNAKDKKFHAVSVIYNPSNKGAKK